MLLLEGEEKDSTYGEYQKEMNMINKAFLELMFEGDQKGRVFTFPIPTYNLNRKILTGILRTPIFSLKSQPSMESLIS